MTTGRGLVAVGGGNLDGAGQALDHEDLDGAHVRHVELAGAVLAELQELGDQLGPEERAMLAAAASSARWALWTAPTCSRPRGGDLGNLESQGTTTQVAFRLSDRLIARLIQRGYRVLFVAT